MYSLFNIRSVTLCKHQGITGKVHGNLVLNFSQGEKSFVSKGMKRNSGVFINGISASYLKIGVQKEEKLCASTARSVIQEYSQMEFLLLAA